ncbi:hypothetical protein WJX72_005790 [[Myrmecia] bisecta]|uniref:valine--tRNA ligase n=1 Tax=[Myrmecia] bisecta TaxID=41462 RepID=A0AAW1QF82_9CHLO
MATSSSSLDNVMGNLKVDQDGTAEANEQPVSGQTATPNLTSGRPANSLPAATGIPAQTQVPAHGQAGEEDPLKKAKKDAKAAEKAAKKAKAEAKAAAAKAAAASKDSGSNKKAKLKADAEAKKAAEAGALARMVADARATPKGERKVVSQEMASGYHPPYVEAAWYEWWEKCGFFKPDPLSTKPPFVMVLPPPNVTGSLHLGHAIMCTIEDTITRWRRMSGFNTLWVPGTDHAGIATQTVVEKKLQRERGITRHDIGRDAFVAETYMWVEEYGGKICSQMRRIGSSVDWSRLAFTMDDKLTAAVKEAFLRLHAEGLIYRENRLVNWDCILKTAVSDIEVDYEEIDEMTLKSVPGYAEKIEFGVLTSFAYQLEDGSGEIVVATTRPETMLGDTAVAVHPDDKRYAHLHGKHVIHPLNNRKIPIICDAELVDMSFGTGAVKITPAHDPNDFATGKRHSLEFINILTDDGCINSNGGQFSGQPRFKARVTVVQWLESLGLFRGKAGNKMRLGVCSRSKDVIEPVLKPQWWVNCQQMAAEARAAAGDGRLEIIPSEFRGTWYRWLDNIRDWCVSRQLWWGHRIPAYYITLEGDSDAGAAGAPSERTDQWVVARDAAEAEQLAAERFPGRKFRLQQDEDVLDTWFSSGLFPFSVFGWPDQTEDLDVFYPTSLLETGHDILFFWVARMVMMGMKLTGKVPFKEIYLHSMVRDAHGRKMSKTLGNVIDPIHVIEGISLEGLHATLLGGNLDPREVEKAKAGQKADFPDGIEECGTDALRFALMSYTSQGGDINLDIKRVVAYRYWCNKLWNAIRFAMRNLGDEFVPSPEAPRARSLPFACRWVLSRLKAAIDATVKGLEGYDFSTSTQAVYAFWQYELCDVFIELMKPVMSLPDGVAESNAQKRATRETLWLCLDAGLRLLHPFMPFVTEELWQRLPRRADQQGYLSIMLTPYPAGPRNWADEQVEADMAFLMTVVRQTRALRTDYGLVKQTPKLYVSCKDAARAAVIADHAQELCTMSTSSEVEVLPNGQAAPKGCAVSIVDDSTTIHMVLAGIFDPAKELDKLQNEKVKTAEKRDALRKRMAMADYAGKTPADIQAAETDRLQKLEAELQAADHHISELQQLL